MAAVLRERRRYVERMSGGFPGVLLLTVLALGGGAGCASTKGAVPRPFPGGGPQVAGRTAAVPAHPRQLASVLRTAQGLAGSPYRNGGADPSGFDCSGFVAYVFGLEGFALPRTVTGLFDVGASVRREAIAPGDLVFFATSARAPTHVGIALGRGEFIHAPSSRGVVRAERLDARYWSRRFVAARRVLAVR
jgi:cell wall-associated NlpC family hydrolase